MPAVGRLAPAPTHGRNTTFRLSRHEGVAPGFALGLERHVRRTIAMAEQPVAVLLERFPAELKDQVLRGLLVLTGDGCLNRIPRAPEHKSGLPVPAQIFHVRSLDVVTMQ